MSKDVSHEIAEISSKDGKTTVVFMGESHNYDNQPRMGNDYEYYNITVFKDTEDGDIEDIENEEDVGRTEGAKLFNKMLQKYIPELYEQERLGFFKCTRCGEEFYPILDREESSGNCIECLDKDEEERTEYKTKRIVAKKEVDISEIKAFESLLGQKEADACSDILKEYYKKLLRFSEDLWEIL